MNAKQFGILVVAVIVTMAIFPRIESLLPIILLFVAIGFFVKMVVRGQIEEMQYQSGKVKEKRVGIHPLQD